MVANSYIKRTAIPSFKNINRVPLRYLQRIFKMLKLLSYSLIEKRSDNVEYYKGNLLLPVLYNEKYVPPPQEVVDLLFGVGKLVPSQLVCNHQPINVEHNRLFLVDLNALKSKNDIKCDESGSWINNSCNKYEFVKCKDNWTECDDEGSGSQKITLKRTYFRLKSDESGDFRRRIDLIECMFIDKFIFDED